MKFLNLIRGLLGRGVVQTVDEAPKMRTVQGEFLLGDVREGLEHFEPYGFTSRVKVGAEMIAGFLNGDRSNGVVIVTADRRYRIRVEEGEVAIFDDIGQKVHLKRSAIEVVTPNDLIAAVGGNVTETVTGNVKLSCSKLDVICPESTFSGVLKVAGQIIGQGGMVISGGSGAEVDGNLSTTGDVTAGGISLQQHTHTEQGDGAETSTAH